MKKQIFTLSAILCFAHYSNAQNNNANSSANAQWRINGNSASTSDFIGTTNNQSLILKSNNIERALFDTQGRTIFDGGGEVIIHPGGLNRPILSNPIAVYMLKVGGSGHFEGEVNARQLFIQEYITFLKSMKGPRIDVDTIRMDSTRGIFGHTKIFGDVQIKQNLEVIGDATFKNNLTAEKGILFDNSNGISYSVNNGLKTFHYGGTGARPATVPCAAAPYSGVLNQFGGWLQIYDPANPTTSGLLNFQTWAGGSSIDASVSGNTPTNVGTSDRLLINYFCGNSTFINTGPNGGEVHLGKTIIGGQSQKTGSYTNALLNVNGIMVAREIVVTAQNWADFVFASDYKLPKLQDVEKYYLANKHLPEIPSEKEVIDNGINVADMNKLLLKKVEELTIYLVQQQKEIEALKNKIK